MGIHWWLKKPEWKRDRSIVLVFQLWSAKNYEHELDSTRTGQGWRHCQCSLNLSQVVDEHRNEKWRNRCRDFEMISFSKGMETDRRCAACSLSFSCLPSECVAWELMKQSTLFVLSLSSLIGDCHQGNHAQAVTYSCGDISTKATRSTNGRQRARHQPTWKIFDPNTGTIFDDCFSSPLETKDNH